jgi:hypothetical protein
MSRESIKTASGERRFNYEDLMAITSLRKSWSKVQAAPLYYNENDRIHVGNQ